MMKIMMGFVFAIAACGVDQVDDNARQELEISAPNVKAAKPLAGDIGTEQAPEPQPCAFTVDCAIGVCDLVTNTCVGDDSWRADLDEQRHGN
jgi:hypothetical protein